MCLTEWGSERGGRMATARFLGAPWSPFAGPRSTDQPCLGPILLQGAAARIYALKWLRIHDQSVDTVPELRVGEEMNTYVPKNRTIWKLHSISRYTSVTRSRTWTASKGETISDHCPNWLHAAAVAVSSDCWNSWCVASSFNVVVSECQLLHPSGGRAYSNWPVILVVRGKLVWSIIGFLYSCQCSACHQ